MKQTSFIELSNGYNLRLNFTMPDEEIDIEELLRIDIANIYAEIVTIPIAMNNFGLLLADVNNALNQAKLKLSIHESKIRRDIREDDSIKDKKTELYFEDAVRLNKGWQLLKQQLNEKTKEYEYINSVYWALKSKDTKLDKLSLTIQSGDIQDELINTKLTRINLVDIKVVRPLIR